MVTRNPSIRGHSQRNAGVVVYPPIPLGHGQPVASHRPHHSIFYACRCFENRQPFDEQTITLLRSLIRLLSVRLLLLWISPASFGASFFSLRYIYPATSTSISLYIPLPPQLRRLPGFFLVRSHKRLFLFFFSLSSYEDDYFVRIGARVIVRCTDYLLGALFSCIPASRWVTAFVLFPQRLDRMLVGKISSYTLERNILGHVISGKHPLSKQKNHYHTNYKESTSRRISYMLITTCVCPGSHRPARQGHWLVPAAPSKSS